jgi:ankyrin repeat protein
MKFSANISRTKIVNADVDKVTCMALDAYSMTNSISSTTTVKRFKKCVGDYNLMSGGRCGWNVCGSAANKNNPELIEYMVGVEPKLLDHPNEFGWTPLFCAVNGGALEAVCKLVELGAGVNIVTTSWCGNSREGPTDRNTSPLYHALHKKQAEIARFLIAHGGLVSPAMSEEELKEAEKCLGL